LIRGFVTAVHAFYNQDVEARHKPAHDGVLHFKKLEPADVAERAKEFTVQVICK
jgi:hypothetical protein